MAGDAGVNRKGLARVIGGSNFYPDRLVDLVEHNDITPAVNQISTHPFFRRAADQELMRRHGVQIESWVGSSKHLGLHHVSLGTSRPTR